jgi:uroporphyrinogen III methyltransferase/synthase
MTLAETGKVYLVGAGPGDPRLITLRGIEVLTQADLILYDGLVNPLILRHSSAHAERTARINDKGHRVLDQDAINQRMIEAAKEGKIVVRLKGGDPFIFGRGSEEAHALAREKIPFEIVPGVTAAVGCAEYAGVSLTHRDFASSVAFITGHEDPSKPESNLDYHALSQFPGTLVFYMGLHRAPLIADQLLQAHKDPKTRCIVISRGTTPFQICVEAELHELSEKIKASALVPPSLLIIGDALEGRDMINWFEQKPLFGQTIAITRALEQVDVQMEMALDLGAHPVLMPMIDIEPCAETADMQRAVSSLQDYQGIVFTSINGIETFMDYLWQQGLDSRALSHVKFACIGPSTAEKLEAYHLRADIVPTSYRSEALAEMMVTHKEITHWLWPRANRGRDIIIETCQSMGMKVDPVVFYEHHDLESLPDEALKLLEKEQLHWVPLSSPAIARQFAKLLPEWAKAQVGKNLKIVCISPVTSAAARESGLEVTAEATNHTWQGIFDEIKHHYQKQEE